MEFFNCFFKVRESFDSIETERLRDECYQYLKTWMDAYFANVPYDPENNPLDTFRMTSPGGDLTDVIGIASPPGGAPDGTCAEIMSICMAASSEISDKLANTPCSASVVSMHPGILSGEVPAFDDDVRASVIHYTPGIPGVYMEQRDIGLSEAAAPDAILLDSCEVEKFRQRQEGPKPVYG